jgi:DNA polymerase-3 subunit epsilon/ATP-dependent DNA helicase DinG
VFEGALVRARRGDQIDATAWFGALSAASGLSDGSDADPAGVAVKESGPTYGGPGRQAPLDVDALEGLLSHGGALADEMGSFEDRPSQREMLRAVAGAFDDAARLFVEAGTGTGKTLAYLLPAASWAVAGGGRVVVSTHTIALQEQLIAKDLPLTAKLVPGLQTTLLKGRSHYLCRSRLAGLGRRRGLDADGARAAAKILAWALLTSTGDRAELRLQPEEMGVWRSVCAEGDACTVGRCPYARAGTCWVHRARRRAESSHIIVVNHALLISDMQAEGRILPPYDRLIIDEAHHLEDVATDQLGFRCTPAGVAELLADVGPKGRRLMPRVEAVGAVLDMPELGRAEVQEAARRLAEVGATAEGEAAAVFRLLKHFHRERAEGAADLRLTAAVRNDPSWLEVEEAWQRLDDAFAQIEPGLGALAAALAPFQENLSDPGLTADLSSVRREVASLRREMGTIIAKPGRSDVAWSSAGGRDKLALARAPLTVGNVLGRRLFADKETVVLTSATLRDSEGFDLIRDRLGLPEADAVAVESPFQYASAALLYLPNDMPDPYHTEHAAALGRALVDLASAAEGRTLVLFTSHSELKAAYHLVRGPLGDAGIAVLGQGIDGTRHNLLEGFRDPQIRTVLMGTRSFWEGIDVPGESLSCLVIARLPFDVPTDPVFAARSELFDDPFGEYALPMAVLRFRQGFGRLIRTATDRGVVVVLDSRILSRAYGETFLDALPPVQRRVGPLASAGAAARQFLEESAAGMDWTAPADPLVTLEESS